MLLQKIYVCFSGFQIDFRDIPSILKDDGKQDPQYLF